jgi:hypothetical protein
MLSLVKLPNNNCAPYIVPSCIMLREAHHSSATLPTLICFTLVRSCYHQVNTFLLQPARNVTLAAKGSSQPRGAHPSLSRKTGKRAFTRTRLPPVAPCQDQKVPAPETPHARRPRERPHYSGNTSCDQKRVTTDSRIYLLLQSADYYLVLR